MTPEEVILRELELIKKNDHYRKYEDNSIFAMALIYIIENISTKNKKGED